MIKNKLYIYQIKIKDADIKERLPFIRFIKRNEIIRSCYIDIIKDCTHYDFLIDFDDSFTISGPHTIHSSFSRPFTIEVMSRLEYKLKEYCYTKNYSSINYKSKYYSSDAFRTEMIDIYGRWDYGMDMIDLLISELMKSDFWIIKEKREEA